MPSSAKVISTPSVASKRAILLGQAGPGVREDADEIRLGQRLQLDPDRQAALQLGQQVARLGDMEGARGDEQDMVGLHRPVFGGDRGALDQRQQIALDALAADRAAAHVADRDLVDLVEEDDAVRLGVLERDAVHVVAVEALVGFLLDELVPGLGDAQLALLARRLARAPCPSCR